MKGHEENFSLNEAIIAREIRKRSIVLDIELLESMERSRWGRVKLKWTSLSGLVIFNRMYRNATPRQEALPFKFRFPRGDLRATLQLTLEIDRNEVML